MLASTVLLNDKSRLKGGTMTYKGTAAMLMSLLFLQGAHTHKHNFCADAIWGGNLFGDFDASGYTPITY